jgi:hypothetical protein
MLSQRLLRRHNVVNDLELSKLSLEDKLKVTQYLIADLAANILSEDPIVKDKARHDIGAMAMTFSNLHQMLTSPDNTKVLNSIHKRFRYDPSMEEAAK